MPIVTGNPKQILAGREGLARYIRTQDRSAPPYFAGRKRLLSDIEDACMDVWHSHENRLAQIEGMTRVIYGAPGAGKSSVLKYLQYAWQQDAYMTLDASGRERPGPTPLVLATSRDIFNSLETICKEIVDLVAPERTEELFAAFSETVRVSGGGSAGFVKGQYEREWTVQHAVARASLTAVAKALPHSEWKRPLVIAIDEAQNLPGDRHSPVGMLLQAFHENQHNLPVMVVMAGLSDTKTCVRELGLSRLSDENVHSLNGLDASEVAELKTGFCAHFKIDLGRYSDQFDALLQRTDGWAAHLQNCLRAFSRVYLEAQCEIDAVDFARVEQLSLASRMRYYHARRSEAMQMSRKLLGLVMEQLKGCEQSDDILGIIRRTADDHAGSQDVGLHLPSDMSVKAYYNDLIHSGALQALDDGKVVCPIPSFRQFLIEKSRPTVGVGSAEGAGHPMREAPQELHYGFTWDALQRIEAAHEIQPAP